MKTKSVGDLVLINSFKQFDQRGSFLKCWSESLMGVGRNVDFKEVYISRSHKNVLRGMHYQKGERSHDKLVVCTDGEVLDVVLDLRENPDTYGKFFEFRLASDREYDAIFIPKGFAHGFKVLSSAATMLYCVTSEYSPEHDTGVRYDTFGCEWEGLENPIVSERDKSLPAFDCLTGIK